MDTPTVSGLPSKLTSSARNAPGHETRDSSSPRDLAPPSATTDRIEDWGAESFLAALGYEGDPDLWNIEESPGGSASPLPASGRVLRGEGSALSPAGDASAGSSSTSPKPRHVEHSAQRQQVAADRDAQPSSSDPAIERASTLLYLSLAHLQILQTTLLGAYHQAVIAFDAAGVRAVATQIVGGLRQMEQAQERVREWVPQAGHQGESGTPAAVSSAMTAVGLPSAELDELARLSASFAEAVRLAVASLTVQLSPQLLGWTPVAGPLEPPSRAKVVHVGAELVGQEAARVVELLEAADQIAALATPQWGGASLAAPPEDLRLAVDELERFQSRPIDAAFLAKVLQRRGVWPELEQARSHGTNRTAANVLRDTQAQAAENGTTADVGPKWNPVHAEEALSYGLTDWAVTDNDALRVVEMLGAASPEARGGLVRALHRKGLLDRMIANVGWQYIKQLAESLNDPEAEALLAPHWEGKGGVPSLGQLLDQQADRNRQEGGLLSQVQAFAWETLDQSLDVFTFGAKPAIDDAREALGAGWISEDAYVFEACKAEVRAGLVGAASMATGGMAGAWSEGAALALGAGEGGSAVLGAAMGGAAGNVGGQLAGDVFDQSFSGKQGFDSFSFYAQTFAAGGLFGAAMAPVGLAAAKYLPAGSRTMAQQLAARHPEMIRVLEAARAAGTGTVFRVRMTVREWLTITGSSGGGPFSSGGLQPVFVMAGAVPDLSALPADAELWITARPRMDLNTLSARFDDDSGPFLDVESIEPERGRGRSAHDRSGSLFDDPGADASYADDPYDYRHDVELEPRATEADTESTKLLAERGTSAMSSQRLGITRAPRHHLLPQEEISFFQKRGFPGRGIDAYCVELPQVEHEIIHGGNRFLALRHWPHREWSSKLMHNLRLREAALQQTKGPAAYLTKEMILREVRALQRYFGIQGYPIVRYGSL